MPARRKAIAAGCMQASALWFRPARGRPLRDARRLLRLELPVIILQRLIKKHPDFSRARRQRMREIGAHQAWLTLPPSCHGAFASHGLERVKERAPWLARHPP